MIHERIVSKNKQSVESIELIESIESESSNQESSSRSIKDTRRASIVSTKIIEDKSENVITSYHVRNIDQLKYWLNKDENALIKAWVKIRDESTFVERISLNNSIWEQIVREMRTERSFFSSKCILVVF